MGGSVRLKLINNEEGGGGGKRRESCGVERETTLLTASVSTPTPSSYI
jgi:hypothetical protein